MQEVEYQKAMELLNNSLKEMKWELNEVDKMSLKGPKKNIAKHMHRIYDDLSDVIDRYSETHNHDDLNHAFNQLEVLKPAFVLNYNEILK